LVEMKRCTALTHKDFRSAIQAESACRRPYNSVYSLLVFRGRLASTGTVKPWLRAQVVEHLVNHSALF
jgi:hypothetical protein